MSLPEGMKIPKKLPGEWHFNPYRFGNATELRRILDYFDQEPERCDESWRRYIVYRAGWMELSWMVPCSWNADGSVTPKVVHVAEVVMAKRYLPWRHDLKSSWKIQNETVTPIDADVHQRMVNDTKLREHLMNKPKKRHRDRKARERVGLEP